MNEQENNTRPTVRDSITGIPNPGDPFPDISKMYQDKSPNPPQEEELPLVNNSEILPEGFVPISQEMKDKISPHTPQAINVPAKSYSELRFQGNVYHQIPNSPPSGQELKFVRCIMSDEQPFGPRRIKLIEGEWKSLEVQGSWITTCSYVIISNLEGRYFTTRPTPEEVALLSRKIIEIGVLPEAAMENPRERTMFSPPKSSLEPIPCALCPAGEDHPFTPAVPLARYRIRAMEGVISCSLTFFPGNA